MFAGLLDLNKVVVLYTHQLLALLGKCYIKSLMSLTHRVIVSVQYQYPRCEHGVPKLQLLFCFRLELRETVQQYVLQEEE